MTGPPRLYTALAPWFPLITPPDEYREEAAIYAALLDEAAAQPIDTLLELGSGGGHNASHLKQRYRMTLTDLSPAMLDLSRRLNPDCEHIEGDMRVLRLGRDFDAVFVHDALDYLTTAEDLRAAIETVGVHCRPGGVALLVPDYVKERFGPRTDFGGSDGDGRAARFLEWDWDPDPDDDTYVVDFAYLLREGERVRIEHDRHVCGVFPRDVWLGLLEGAGFRAEARVIHHSDEDVSREAFLAVKTAS
ncbi:MAG TPA: class I SAM-dependent methyltransferase [Actinomycetota bacterium]|nr:class I SAM-dependent methyltransferase [Actinomycetota bacterium]